MFYAASKVLTFLLQPSTFLLVLIVAGLLLQRSQRRQRLGIRLIATGAAGYFIAGILPLSNLLILPLEQRYAGIPAPAADEKITGIIMLGGFEDGWVSKGRGGVALNEAAERLTEGVRLALKHPESRVIFTGGVGGLLSGGTDAATPIGQLLQDWGIAADRIVLEGKSRNTLENAEFTRALVDPKRGERWLLVTSAYHMPRAMGVFRHAGFAVEPHAVDFRTHGEVDVMRLFETVGDGLRRTDMVFKEWIGLLVYRLTGRTDELFPGPAD
ncbi:MAG: YdcF family protein [Hyphomicrobiaceae bacterium]|nr:YdcF family protein [Hyphomicrobiaceae bacterium]